MSQAHRLCFDEHMQLDNVHQSWCHMTYRMTLYSAGFVASAFYPPFCPILFTDGLRKVGADVANFGCLFVARDDEFGDEPEFPSKSAGGAFRVSQVCRVVSGFPVVDPSKVYPA